MVERDVERLLVLACIDRRTGKIGIIIIPNRQRRNRIAHARPVIVNGKCGMLRELLAHAECPRIAALIFQRGLKYAVYFCVVALAQRTENLRPAEICAEGIVKYVFCVECIGEDVHLSFSLHIVPCSRRLIA